MRVLYNEGRVVGLSAYELFVRDQISRGVDPEDIPSEPEWITRSVIMARGGSMILVVPANTAAGYHDFTLPQGTTLVPGTPLYATLFEGEVTPESVNGVWAAHVTDNGRLISNTSTRHPVTPGLPADVPAKSDTSVPSTYQQQCIEYMKITSAIAIQPGQWVASDVAAPEMKLEPDLTVPGFIRILCSEALEVAVPILITGFVSTEVVKTGMLAEDFGVTYKSGEFIGPAVFPWASKVEMLVTAGPLKEFIDWYVPSKHPVYYHVDTGNIIPAELTDGSDVILQAPTATKAGWTFVGWRLDTQANSDVLSSLLANRDDIHVYAVFQKIITVTLSGGSSVLYDSGNSYYNNNNSIGASITLSTVGNPYTSDWMLMGYREDQQPLPVIPYQGGSTYTFNDSITLYAIFVQRLYLYVTQKGLRMDYSGMRRRCGDNISTLTLYAEDPTSLQDATFLGYSDDPNSTTIVNTTLSTGIEITDDTYRYAVWKYDDAVLDTSTHSCYRRGPGSVDVTTLDTTHYERLAITASCKITMAQYATQNNATLNIGSAWFMTGHAGQQQGERIEVAVEGTNTWWTSDSGGYLTANAASQTVTTSVLSASSTYQVQVVLALDVNPWDEHDTSGATVTRIEGLGRTVVY